MKKKFIGSLLLLILLISSVTTANAAPMKDAEWENRKAYIEENIIALGSQDFETVENWLFLNGFQDVEVAQNKDGLIQPLSTNANVSITSFDAYYDTRSSRYLIKGWWIWKGTSYLDVSAGAVDGVMLAMYNSNFAPVSGYEYTSSNPTGIAVYDQNGTHYPNVGGLEDVSGSGLVWTFQDYYDWNNYVGFKGQVWAWLDKKPTDSTVYLKLDYRHTYSSATFNSGTISWSSGTKAPSISLSFSVAPQAWTATNIYKILSWPNN
ncbi:MAG: hypothetical protein AAGU76_11680 [Sedimentibacter sp.]|uniref:hypothetical protein n=1 Tax=Sedimentibacter sp. TaxID=1960295 RepID=UPI003158DFA9